MKKAMWKVSLAIVGIGLCVSLTPKLYVGQDVPNEDLREVLSDQLLDYDELMGQEQNSAESDKTEEETKEEETKEEETKEEEVFREYDITLMAVGDNLMHMGVVNSGKQENGSYNYDFLYENLAGILQNTDINIINQETVFGGNQLGFSGFPRFNSPTEVGDAIAKAGFNVVLNASNHAADQNYKGMENAMQFWKKYPEVLSVGMKEDVEDTDIPMIAVKEKTFAILNYTYGPNLESVPSEIRGHLAMLCPYNEKNGLIDFTRLNPQVLEDIRRAEELADVVIVCPHWGTEYQTKASSYQKEWALQMTEAGADLIIGTHPHVPEPIEWIVTENGNRALCFYSLGNYVSTQKQALCMLEGMAYVRFHVTEDAVTLDESGSGVVPLVCHYNSGPVRVEKIYFLEDYTEEQADSHGIRNYGGVILRLSDLQKWSDEIFGDFVMKKANL